MTQQKKEENEHDKSTICLLGQYTTVGEKVLISKLFRDYRITFTPFLHRLIQRLSQQGVDVLPTLIYFCCFNNRQHYGLSVNKISKAVINYETTKVTGISVAASLLGGAAAVGAAVADITSYFAFILRTVQELAYGDVCIFKVTEEEKRMDDLSARLVIYFDCTQKNYYTKIYDQISAFALYDGCGCLKATEIHLIRNDEFKKILSINVFVGDIDIDQFMQKETMK